MSTRTCGIWLAALALSAAGFLLSTTAESAPTEALVVVSGESIGTVSPSLFGANLVAAHLNGDDAGGLWDPADPPCGGGIVGCYHPAAFELLSRMGPDLLRFPGGRQTRSYDWEKGVGPAPAREYLFGVDEFLYLTHRLGATPVITVSLYDPDDGAFATAAVIQRAAAWVDYVNHESPYGPVVYWEVDSDAWETDVNPLNPDISYDGVAPQTYADAFLAMAAAMKAVDPTINIGAVSYETKGPQETYQMLRRIADMTGDQTLWPDFLTMEFFRPNFDSNRCDLYGVDLELELQRIMAAAFAASRELDTRIAALLQSMDEAWGDEKRVVPILVSQYGNQILFADQMTNYPGPGDPPDCPFRNLAHSLGAGIYNADVLLTLLRYADQLLGAGMWDFMDGQPPDLGEYGAAYRWNEQIVPRPNAEVFQMLARDFRPDEILRTNVLVSTFDNEEVGRTPSYRSLDLAADESYIRVRIVRRREPVENTRLCGASNEHNPDPISAIDGAFLVDNLSLKQDGVPPALAEELLVNGDFQLPLDQGWQVASDPPGVTTDRYCQGEVCVLRLRFDSAAANNPDYLEQVTQTVNVTPGLRYRLSFDYAADSLTVKTQNLLCDPSFEYTSTPGNFNNAYWIQYGGTPCPATIVAGQCEDAAQCVRVPIFGNPEFYHVRQQYPLVNTADPGTSDPDAYHVVGYVKTENLDGPAMIEAQARDSNDQLIQAENSDGLFGNADWTRQDLRLRLVARSSAAAINVHLRRFSGRKDNGVATFDNVRMYREETAYAPKIVADICKDAACTVRRSVETDGIMGTTGPQSDSLAGTPLVKALAGRRADGEIELLLINKDLATTRSASIDLTALDLPADWVILSSVLTAETVDADNEPTSLGPEINVTDDGGSYLSDMSSPTFAIDLPPHSITGLKVVDPEVREGSPEPIDDDYAPPDDDADGDHHNGDENAAAGSGGCGC
jgi:hypothetical protein